MLLNLAETRVSLKCSGYMAPEYALHGIFSAKSDVFSYGVLVLEIITGRRNTYTHASGPSEDLLTYVIYLRMDPFLLRSLNWNLCSHSTRHGRFNSCFAWSGLEAMEPRKCSGAAGGVPGRGAAAAGDAEVHPRRAALRPRGPAASARHGVRRRHAQQPLHHTASARRAGVRGAETACIHGRRWGRAG
jgi:hypothetical protein